MKRADYLYFANMFNILLNWLSWLLATGWGWNYFVETMFCPSDFQNCNITILQTNQQRQWQCKKLQTKMTNCVLSTHTRLWTDVYYYCSQRGTLDHWLARYSETNTNPPVVSQNTARRSKSPGRRRRTRRIGAEDGGRRGDAKQDSSIRGKWKTLNWIQSCFFIWEIYLL